MDLSGRFAQSSAMSWFARFRLPVSVCVCVRARACMSVHECVLGVHNRHLAISLLTVGPGERPGESRQRSLDLHRKWFSSAEIKLCHRASQRGSSLHSPCAQVRPLGGGLVEEPQEPEGVQSQHLPPPCPAPIQSPSEQTGLGAVRPQRSPEESDAGCHCDGLRGPRTEVAPKSGLDAALFPSQPGAVTGGPGSAHQGFCCCAPLPQPGSRPELWTQEPAVETGLSTDC